MRKVLEKKEEVNGFKTTYSISARTKNHYCPKCDELLEVVRKEQVVNSKSEEAKNFDFSDNGDMSGVLHGNIRFKWDAFYCSKCNIETPVGIIFRYNRERRKSIRKARREKKMQSR